MSCLQTRSGPGARQQQQDDTASKSRTIQELSAKTRTIQELSGSVEQLQDRKRCPSSSNHRTKTRPPATPPRAATPPSCSPAAGESFPAVFTGRSAAQALLLLPGSHVSDVLQESEALKHRLELAELHAEQEKEALEVEVAEAREQLLR